MMKRKLIGEQNGILHIELSEASDNMYSNYDKGKMILKGNVSSKHCLFSRKKLINHDNNFNFPARYSSGYFAYTPYFPHLKIDH